MWISLKGWSAFKRKYLYCCISKYVLLFAWTSINWKTIKVKLKVYDSTLDKNEAIVACKRRWGRGFKRNLQWCSNKCKCVCVYFLCVFICVTCGYLCANDFNKNVEKSEALNLPAVLYPLLWKLKPTIDLHELVIFSHNQTFIKWGRV